MPFGEWFTMDVIVDGKALDVRLNGKPSSLQIRREQSLSERLYRPATTTIPKL